MITYQAVSYTHLDVYKRQGIYRLSLTPKVAGTGKLIFDIVTKSFTDQIIIENIQVYANEAEALKNQSHEYLVSRLWKHLFLLYKYSKRREHR